MLPTRHTFSLVIAIAILATSTSFAQIMFDGSPGTAAPPGTLGPYSMTAFGPDPAALFTGVTSAPGPAGSVGFSSSLTHYKVGSGWATWSHGYTGDVYFRTATSLTMTMPANTVAFYFYAEPQAFSLFTVTATAQDGGTSGPISVHGSAGAKYFGFFSTGGVPLTSIAVTCTDGSGFAVGEFGIFQCASPGITVSVTPDMLWPPNHTMASIVATVTTTGNCGGNVVTLESVTSNEPDNGDDDGNTINDIQNATTGIADYMFDLRKERSGVGSGRVYTATYKVVDIYGNMATGSATVTVPLNMTKSGAGISEIPGTLELEQNYPNPFNPSTSIQYGVPYDGHVRLAVYDLMGREVATLVNSDMKAGSYSAAFDAQGLASGMYIYRLTHDGQSTYRTMTLSK